MFSMYASIVISFDQWFSVQVMCHSGRNLVARRHQWVVPLKISWGGKKSPVRDPAKTAIICHLSSTPTISTLFEPSFSIVHDPTGT